MYNQYQSQPYGAPPPGQQPYIPPAPFGQQSYAPPQPGPQGYGPPQGGQYNAAGNAQQFYGGQPNGQYGAPPGQYGAPPPAQPQQYGAPPGQYGAPPPQQQSYGSGPPQQQFGAPPPSQYGAPSQQPPFGAQQAAPGGGPRFLGVTIPAPPPAMPVTNLPGYNAQFDAERIRKATKGFGTDERALIDVLSPLDAFQMDVLARTYEQQTGRTLQKELEKELSGWLEYTLVLLALGPLNGDLHLLNRACKGAGTHEDLLNEVLLCRSNEEIFLLKEGFKRVYGKDLVQTVRGELSMKTERMFNMALSGTRDESPYVNQQLVQQDVEALYRAGPGKVGTDEIAICGILLSRSDAHLQAIAQQFPQRHRTSLSQMIRSEFSGHMAAGLLFIAEKFEADGQGVNRDANMLEAAMAGAGTKDERMIYRIVRAHWDRPRFGAIKNQFQTNYRMSLKRRVEGETTGKYEKALVGIIDMN